MSIESNIDDEQGREKLAYVKPELREYGAIAELTAAIGTKAMGDGGTAPLDMSVSA